MIQNILKELLGTEVPDAAMDAASQAISKFVSDCYVRKELYKEKLAEASAMSERLKTAEEALSTAADRLTDFETAQRCSEVRSILETGGVNPHFIKLFEGELMDCEDTQEALERLKTEYPIAFGEILTEKPDVAVRPCLAVTTPNPWNRDKPDLSAQTRLYRENPAAAGEMARSAGVLLT